MVGGLEGEIRRGPSFSGPAILLGGSGNFLEDLQISLQAQEIFATTSQTLLKLWGLFSGSRIY
jgi:hypothetical protein